MSTILLVEDEPNLRDVVASVLEDEGFTVLAAIDGLDALSQLSRELPHLVITDVMMPRMGGRELLFKIRATEEWSSIPVVMISAVAAPGAENLDIDGFIAKPFELDHLLETVREVLAVRSPGEVRR